jgi:hypothetical protein
MPTRRYPGAGPHAAETNLLAIEEIEYRLGSKRQESEGLYGLSALRNLACR